MRDDKPTQGASELSSARHVSLGLIVSVILFSLVVNALMLTGPLYMLQIYGRVIVSGSVETLTALSILMTALFFVMGVLEFIRGQLMAIVGARFQIKLDQRVFSASLQISVAAPNDSSAVVAQRDLEAIRSFLASPVMLALIDLPWTPVFLAPIFVFHPYLGWLATAGGVLLILATWANQTLSRKSQSEAGKASLEAERFCDQLKTEAETIRALGMSGASFQRWQASRQRALEKSFVIGRTTGFFSSFTKTFRLYLQSAMLGLGAWLVLKGELSSGAMVASSTLMGRALSPVEMAVGQWAMVQRYLEAWRRLSVLLSRVPNAHTRTALPRPRALLEVEGLTVGAPGEPSSILKNISFRIEPGQAVGVIGQSGSGKSTLAKALTGIWHPLAGRIRLDGASLDQYDPDVLGGLLGYLPQRIALFDGTIAENISRFVPEATSESIIAAAKKADAHGMIVKLPKGYDTQVSAAGGRLSGGQIQRIGLARALYGDPVLLILDEPNSNLDNDGSVAVNAAIRVMKSEGKSILIMAHRPAAIQECDLLLMIEAGARKGFGPRDQVLRDLVRNNADILKPHAQTSKP